MDWFKWDEEGVDWRRVIPHKKRQAVGIDPAGALICTIAGQCGSPGCVLPDFHAGPCTPFAVPPRKRTRSGAGQGEVAVELPRRSRGRVGATQSDAVSLSQALSLSLIGSGRGGRDTYRTA